MVKCIGGGGTSPNQETCLGHVSFVERKLMEKRNNKMWTTLPVDFPSSSLSIFLIGISFDFFDVGFIVFHEN